MRASGEVLPPGEPRGCHTVWVIAAGCAVSLRSCPVAQGGSSSQGFTHHVLPSSEGDPSRGSLSLRFLVFIPWKFFQQLWFCQEFMGGSTAPLTLTGMAVPFGIRHLCWHRACAGTGSSLGFWHSMPLELLVIN